MTRFARAKGSKASNERLPEKATPWKTMQQELLNTQKEIQENKEREKMNIKRQQKFDEFLEETYTKTPKKWAEFPTVQIAKPINVKHNIKKKEIVTEDDVTEEMIDEMCEPDSEIDEQLENMKADIEKALGKEKIKVEEETGSGSDEAPEETTATVKPMKIKVKKNKKKKQPTLQMKWTVKNLLLDPDVKSDDETSDNVDNGHKPELIQNKNKNQQYLTKNKNKQNKEEMRDNTVQGKQNTEQQQNNQQQNKKQNKKNKRDIKDNVVVQDNQNINIENQQNGVQEKQYTKQQQNNQQLNKKKNKKNKRDIKDNVVQDNQNNNIENQQNGVQGKQNTKQQQNNQQQNKKKNKQNKRDIKDNIVQDNQNINIENQQNGVQEKQNTKQQQNNQQQNKKNNKKNKRDIKDNIVQDNQGINIENQQNNKPQDNKQGKNNQNQPQSDNTNKKRKLPFGDANSEHKRRKPIDTEKLKFEFNGVEETLTQYYGYPIRKSDVKRIDQLRATLKNKGVPQTQIDRATVVERRKASKVIARMRNKVCFVCRKLGHELSACPEVNKDQQIQTIGSGICYKCGSTEHISHQCRAKNAEGYKFATCFICKEQGHLTRQCPDNPRGLYPNGGACKLCGAVTHMKKDCPKSMQERQDNTVSVDTIFGGNIEGLEGKVKKSNEKKQVRTKVVSF